MNNNILVVASHPDDEVIGCGGTIAKHVEKKDNVHLLFMSDGVTSRKSCSEDEFKLRKNAAINAKSILGASSIDFLDFPDNKMDTVPFLNVVQKLELVLNKIKPSIIYTHHHGDLNIDHQITQKSVMTACRPMPGSIVKEIYGFEIMSSTEWSTPQQSVFIPNYFVDISKQLSTKIKALQAYKEEMRPMPHSRSIDHIEILARHRGNCVGIDAAEAFEVYRMIK